MLREQASSRPRANASSTSEPMSVSSRTRRARASRPLSLLGGVTTKSSAPLSTVWPSATLISVTIPSDRRLDLVLHLHRLEDHDTLALGDGRADASSRSSRPCRASRPRRAAGRWRSGFTEPVSSFERSSRAWRWKSCPAIEDVEAMRALLVDHHFELLAVLDDRVDRLAALGGVDVHGVAVDRDLVLVVGLLDQTDASWCRRSSRRPRSSPPAPSHLRAAPEILPRIAAARVLRRGTPRRRRCLSRLNATIAAIMNATRRASAASSSDVAAAPPLPPAMCWSMKPVSYLPARKTGWFTTFWWNGIEVLMPFTTNSESARRNRSIASARSRPQTTSFATIGS